MSQYTPTKEEERVIKRANDVFLSYYVTGMLGGLVGAYGFLRYRKLRLFSFEGVWTMIGFGLAGEIAGRQLGKFSAQQVIQEMPQGKLRQLLQERGQISASGRTNASQQSQMPTYDSRSSAEIQDQRFSGDSQDQRFSAESQDSRQPSDRPYTETSYSETRPDVSDRGYSLVKNQKFNQYGDPIE